MSESELEVSYEIGMVIEAMHPDHDDWRGARVKSVSGTGKYFQVEFVTGNAARAMVTPAQMRHYSAANVPEGLTADTLISNKLGELIDKTLIKGVKVAATSAPADTNSRAGFDGSSKNGFGSSKFGSDSSQKGSDKTNSISHELDEYDGHDYQDPDAWVTCPFDSNHEMPWRTFQGHIIHCRLMHVTEHHFTCPYNFTHIMLKADFDQHLLECPDVPVNSKLVDYGYGPVAVSIDNPFDGQQVVSGTWRSGVTAMPKMLSVATCQICNRRFKTFVDLQAHKRSKHAIIEPDPTALEAQSTNSLFFSIFLLEFISVLF